jgi:phosphoesterase RecJ-like protein
MAFSEKQIIQLENYVKEANNITLITHANPDADTIGSALALQNVLLQMDKNAIVVCPNPIPDFMQWMHNLDKIIIHDREGKKVQKAVENADLIFAMDFNAPHRTSNIEKSMLETKAKKILIDHHLFPDEEYFDLMFSFPEKSSTSELLFNILSKSDYKKYINKEIATNIFVGLMTDTGSFAYSCNQPETFEAAAELIRYGVVVKETHDLVYNNNSVDRLRALGYSISEKLRVFPKHHAAYISLSADELRSYGDSDGLTEGIVNYALSIKGICFAALLTEKGDKVKISFRSKGTYNVNSFARKHFQGGGHHNAAGGKSYLSLDKTIEKLEKLITKLDIKC